MQLVLNAMCKNLLVYMAYKNGLNPCFYTDLMQNQQMSLYLRITPVDTVEVPCDYKPVVTLCRYPVGLQGVEQGDTLGMGYGDHP